MLREHAVRFLTTTRLARSGSLSAESSSQRTSVGGGSCATSPALTTAQLQMKLRTWRRVRLGGAQRLACAISFMFYCFTTVMTVLLLIWLHFDEQRE